MLMLFHNALTKIKKNIEKLQRFDLSYFLGKIFNICFFINQYLIRGSKKKTRSLNMLLVQNQKRMYASKLTPSSFCFFA